MSFERPVSVKTRLGGFRHIIPFVLTRPCYNMNALLASWRGNQRGRSSQNDKERAPVLLVRADKYILFDNWPRWRNPRISCLMLAPKLHVSRFFGFIEKLPSTQIMLYWKENYRELEAHDVDAGMLNTSAYIVWARDREAALTHGLRSVAAILRPSKKAMFSSNPWSLA